MRVERTADGVAVIRALEQHAPRPLFDDPLAARMLAGWPATMAAHRPLRWLFLRALDRYIADALARMDMELGPGRDPVDGLRMYLAGYVERASGANGRRGCLLVATAMELAGRDADVDRRIASFFKAMETSVADALGRAKTAGRLADGVEPSTVARILVCFVEGLRVIGKTAPTRATSQAAVDALLGRFIT